MPRVVILRLAAAAWVAAGAMLFANFAWGPAPRLYAQVPQHELFFRTQPAKSVEAGEPLLVRVSSFVGGTGVTVKITPGSGASGARLDGTTTQEWNLPGSPTAEFSDLSITTAATGYSLTATLDGSRRYEPPTDTSNLFDVTPAAPSQLSFASQPTDTAVGQQVAPPVKVQVQDRFGNLVRDYPVRVSVALAPGAAAGALRGTLSTVTSDGTAEFGDLQIDTPGKSYALVATAEGTGWQPVVSEPFRVYMPTLSFRQQPRSVTAGTVISPPVAVQLTDQDGGVVSDRYVRLRLRGPAGASLDGNAVMLTSNGVATFSQLSINRAGTGYRLVASAAGALPRESDPFAVRPGPAVALAFARQPGTGAEHGELSPQPWVSVQDRYGNTSGNAVRITLGIAPRRGASSGRLTCDGGSSRLASHGVVSFTGCRIDRAGEGYRLIATADRLREALSQPFDIRPLGARGSWWPLAVAGAAVILLIVTVTAGIRRARGHRAVHPGERTRAEPHPDVGTVDVVSERGSRTHAIRLEPHADRGTAHLEEQP